MVSLGEEMGGASKAKAMLNAQGISLILKSIDVQFRRPVTYPDTVCRTLFLDSHLHIHLSLNLLH